MDAMNVGTVKEICECLAKELVLSDWSNVDHIIDVALPLLFDFEVSCCKYRKHLIPFYRMFIEEYFTRTPNTQDYMTWKFVLKRPCNKHLINDVNYITKVSIQNKVVVLFDDLFL